jgi:hypothetical protein
VIILAFSPRILTGSFLRIMVLTLLCTGVLAIPVSAYGYSTDYEGYLGEIISLHGEAYNSDQIYLFMTGPGLPENGVTLKDTTQRADQGQFTTVGVDSNQQWSFKWDTLKLEDQIDPGTYTVYAVNAPVDKSNLAGHSYQTLSVYLKDGKLSKDRVSIGTNYAVNLADDDPNVTYTIRPTVTTPLPTSPPTTIPVVTTAPTTVPTPLPTTTKKSPALPGVAVAGCAIAAGLYLSFAPGNKP